MNASKLARRIVIIQLATREGLPLDQLGTRGNAAILARLLGVSATTMRADVREILELVEKHGAERVAAIPRAFGAVGQDGEPGRPNTNAR